ncbi:MAG: tetratricopeptide repeat protein [bacterium]
MAIDPRAVKFHTLGNKLVEEQKFNEAIVNYEKAIELAPDYSAAHYHLAEALEYKKLDDQSAERYAKAIELNPSYATMHIDSGLDTLLSGPLGKAVADYKKAKGLAGNKPGGGVTVAAPKEGSPVAMATQPAVRKEKARGQKGLKPLKTHLRPSDEHISTEVWGVDSVIAEVLGAKDIPVAEGNVTFKILNAPELEDAYLAADRTQAAEGHGPKSLTIATDGDGRATVYFRRSKRAGLNRLEVRPEGGHAVFLEDNTHSGDVRNVDIQPAQKNFTTGQQVNFIFTAFDEHGNVIPDLDLAFVLFGKKRQEWEIIDNIGGKTDQDGRFERVFTMPTIGNIPCRMEVKHKKTEFKAERPFKVIPGSAHSMLFIPAKSVFRPGDKFTLKMRLMDDFDNGIEGLPARIALKEASGGEWQMGAQSSEVTGEDGSISVEITAPGETSARAVFTVETEALAQESKLEARFETKHDSEVVSPVASAGFANDLDLDMEMPAPPASGPSPADALFGIELGAGDISGLPDISAAPAPAGGFGEVKPAQEGFGDGMPGGMAGLESLDLGIGSAPAFGESPVAAPAAAIEKPGEFGSSFDQLGSMLDADSGVPPAPEFAVPENPAPIVPAIKLSADDLPYETEAGNAELVLDEPVLDEPIIAARPDKTKFLTIHVESEAITCRAGEAIPLKARVTGEDGRPVSAGVSVTFIIEDIPGMASDSHFIVPAGTQGIKTYEADPDLSGEVVSTIQASARCGKFNVMIAALDARGRVAVSVAPGIPSSIELSAPEEVMPGQTVEIAAKAFDKFGNPVPGEFMTIMPENYTGQLGEILGSATQTDMNGEAKIQYRASANPGDTATFTAQNPNVSSFGVKKATVKVKAGSAPAIPEAAPYAPPEVAYAQPPAAEFAAPAPPPDIVDAGAAAASAAEQEEEVDEYLKSIAEADPYAPPKFDVKRGKKPVMEITALLPKILKYTGILAVLILVAFGGLASYKFFFYQYYFTKGLKNYTSDNLGDALVFFEKANKINANIPDPLQYEAEIYIKQAQKAREFHNEKQAEQEYNLALSVLDKELQLNPNNIDALYYMGQAYEGKKSYCNAISQFQRILQIDPTYESAQTKIKLLSGSCRR